MPAPAFTQTCLASISFFPKRIDSVFARVAIGDDHLHLVRRTQQPMGHRAEPVMVRHDDSRSRMLRHHAQIWRRMKSWRLATLSNFPGMPATIHDHASVRRPFMLKTG
jgi:hypothetical protein